LWDEPPASPLSVHRIRPADRAGQGRSPRQAVQHQRRTQTPGAHSHSMVAVGASVTTPGHFGSQSALQDDSMWLGHATSVASWSFYISLLNVEDPGRD